MTGHLELVDAPDGGYRVLMVDGDDSLMGLSRRYASVDEAVQAVEGLREVAGTGLLRQGSADRYALLESEEFMMDRALAGPAPEQVEMR
ncbi:hypothetical protein ACIPY3_09345 [Paenarthrobacter sp. NPDC089714]|uniref:hypothetical protein n=1 Tax=unclassified Paenarthrobacter TaxID=2634190 RepID=UPI003810CCF5